MTTPFAGAVVNVKVEEEIVYAEVKVPFKYALT
jgi:hypothetical protein